MNEIAYELAEFFVLVFVAIFFLYHLIRELQPKNQGLWVVGVSLGTGVVAFGVKIALIIVFSTYPEPMLAMLPKVGPQNLGEEPAVIESFSFTQDESSYVWQALPAVAPYPMDNPPSVEKIELGKKLFFDKRLSFDGTLSCASCHEVSQDKGGTDGLPTSVGIDQQIGGRNAPTVVNAAFQKVLFWDGRAASLEEQAKGPLVNPIEMGMPSESSVVQRVKAIDDYRDEFSRVFGGENDINIDQIAKAIAAYERTLVTPDSAFDRFIRGDMAALTDQQLRGMVLFESMGCVTCHTGPNFSDASLYSDSQPYRIFPAHPDKQYEEKYQFSKDGGKMVDRSADQKEFGVWRVPSLRNVAITGPYFHNGSVDNLEEAVRIMAQLQLNKMPSNRSRDDESYTWSDIDKKMHVTTNSAISDEEVESLVAFLESLTGDVSRLSRL